MPKSSNIKLTSCAYDPTGGTDYAPITNLNRLSSGGDLDISYLVHRVATEHFGYTGNDTYTLTLKNNKVVMQLASGGEFGTLNLQKNGWQLVRNDGINPSLHFEDTSAIVEEILDRMRKASGKTAAPSKEPANTMPPITNVVNCNHSEVDTELTRKLIEENTILKMKNEQYITEKEVAQNAQKTAETRLRKIQADQEDLKQELEALQKQLDDKNQSLKKVTKEKNTLSNKNSELIISNERLKAETQEAILAKEKLHWEALDLEHQIKMKDKDIQTAEARTGEKQQSIEILVADKEKLQQQIKATQNKLDSQQERIDNLNEERGKLNARIAGNETLISQLQMHAAEKKNQISQLHNQIITFQNDELKLSSQLAAVKQDQQHSAANVKRLNQALQTINEEKEQIERKYTQEKEHRERLNFANNKLEIWSDVNAAKIKELDKQNTILGIKKQHLEETIKDLKFETEMQRLKMLDQSITTRSLMQQQQERHKKALSERQEQIDALDQELEETKKKYREIRQLNKRASTSPARFTQNTTSTQVTPLEFQKNVSTEQPSTPKADADTTSDSKAQGIQELEQQLADLERELQQKKLIKIRSKSNTRHDRSPQQNKEDKTPNQSIGTPPQMPTLIPNNSTKNSLKSKPTARPPIPKPFLPATPLQNPIKTQKTNNTLKKKEPKSPDSIGHENKKELSNITPTIPVEEAGKTMQLQVWHKPKTLQELYEQALSSQNTLVQRAQPLTGFWWQTGMRGVLRRMTQRWFQTQPLNSTTTPAQTEQVEKTVPTPTQRLTWMQWMIESYKLVASSLQLVAHLKQPRRLPASYPINFKTQRLFKKKRPSTLPPAASKAQSGITETTTSKPTSAEKNLQARDTTRNLRNLRAKVLGSYLD